MAEEKKETPMLDPIAYRSDYNPNDIDPEYRNDPNLPGVGPLNANENYQEYGDDSNPAWQGQKGGLNPKYEGEGVMNTYIDYNPNLRTGDLDPNYLFGENARQQNAKEKGYIARRNDMIASALYNEGKTSKEDISNYLSAQKGWFDSTESDRLNTIDSIWKRLGQQGDKGTYKADESNADSIVKDGEREGTIYGKNSADNTNPEKGINTLSDANSPYTIMEEARAANLKTLLGMPIEDIATALDEGLLPSDLQSIRDYQQYYPELWSEVKQYQKKIKTQNTVDAISNGGEISTENNGQSIINNSIAEFSNKNAGAIKSSQEISQDVRNSLAKNQTASEASETMASIEEDMAILKNRLSNLKQEANSKFKGDVPDYLVRAYVANKTQEIQNQMSILENRYNMAMNRYKTEVANTQWEKEYALKVQELQLKQDSAALNDWATKQNIAIKWAELGKDDKAKTDSSGYEVSTMSDDAIASVIDYLMDMYDNHQLGNAQCAAGIQKYYLPLLGISLPNLSDYQNKLKLINEGKDYMPKKGDLIIFSDFADEHGHIGIVTATNEFNEGEITYLDWNGSVDANGEGTEAVKARVINIKDKKIMGFRNINKGSSSSSSSKEWSDVDYTNFTNFLDSNNKDITDSDRKSIAAMYGFDKDDLEGMREFASEQLKSKPEIDTPNNDDEVDIDDRYDEKLGYNPLHAKFYQQYYNDRLFKLADLAEKTGTTEAEARRRADNWKANKGDANRERLADGMTESQNKILQEIVDGKRKGDEDAAALLGFGGDVELLGQAIAEVVKDEGQTQIDNALRTLAELQIVFEDSDHFKNGEFDRSVWGGTWWASNRKIKFNQLKAQLKLDKVVNSRAQGVTYGSMTEGEWKMLEEAVSSLSMVKQNDKEFTQELKNIIAYLWSASYGDPSTPGVIQGPTSEQWNNYVKQVRESTNFDIIASDSDKTISNSNDFKRDDNNSNNNYGTGESILNVDELLNYGG